MTQLQQYDYGQCKYCGAKMVISQRTGKPYCSAKCWNKNQSISKPQEPNWDKIRAEKAEDIALNNAKNCAVALLAAAINNKDMDYATAIIRLEELVKQIYEIGMEEKVN